MKKILSLATFVFFAWCLSLVNKYTLIIILLSMLFCFIAYMYFTSKKTENNKLTFLYVTISFLFVSYVLNCILGANYLLHPFSTILVLGVIAPTFFLLGYRIILSIHCFVDSIISSNKQKDFAESSGIGCSIVIATSNEPFDVCKMTFDSTYALDYPSNLREIIVVDNSDLTHHDFNMWRDYVNNHNMVDGVKCVFIHRDGTDGYKPRNLDIAVKNTNFEYVLFLDADSTLPANTLKVGMHEFIKDKKVGFVSFLIESTNYHMNLVTKVTSIFQNTIRYFNEFVGKYGYCNYQGHNGIWSKKALQATSQWEEYYKSHVMVTEDIAAGFRCYEAGFVSKPIFLKTGEWVPTSLKEFEKMWLRWSFGGMQVMHKYISKIIGSPNLYFRVKLDMLYLLFKVVASGFPIFAMLLAMFPRSDPGFVLVVNITLIPLILLSVWYYFHGDIYGSVVSKITQIYIAMFMLSSYVFWCGIKAEINFYLNKGLHWTPTSKVFDKVDGWPVILYENLGKLTFSFVGLVFASMSLYRFYSSEDFIMYVLCMLPSILLFLNTILCVLILGRSK